MLDSGGMVQMSRTSMRRRPIRSNGVGIVLKSIPLSAAIQETEDFKCPDEFHCSITQSPMKDPVTAADGICYERKAIERWFKQGKDTSPSTSVVSASQTLYPSVNLRQIMQGIIDGMDAVDGEEDASERVKSDGQAQGYLG